MRCYFCGARLPFGRCFVIRIGKVACLRCFKQALENDKSRYLRKVRRCN